LNKQISAKETVQTTKVAQKSVVVQLSQRDVPLSLKHLFLWKEMGVMNTFLATGDADSMVDLLKKHKDVLRVMPSSSST